MKPVEITKRAMVILLCLAVILPTSMVQAAMEAPMKVVDVQLQENGLLQGQLVDTNGKPLAKAAVSLSLMDQQVALTETDANGRFQLMELRGGTYRIFASGVHGVFRLWAPRTGPPNAQPGVLLIAGDGPVRGQCGPFAYWLSNPWVLTGIAAAAIAIPVAIHNSRVEETTSP